MDSIDYYNQNATEYFEETMNLDLEEVMQPFVELLPENAEVLDLGCGSGRDVISLEEHGFSVTAMDGSQEMCKLAEIHTNMEVLHLSYDEMDFDEVFQGIWACASLVHISYNKMPIVLGKVLDALKEGGILYFSVRHGCGSCWDNGREFYDYTEETLNTLLRQVQGCEVINVWESDDIQKRADHMPWWNVLIRKHSN